ncbi:MAG: hypothetical protein ACI4CS_04160, partial [Candidatus Weimeria sp.]
MKRTIKKITAALLCAACVLVVMPFTGHNASQISAEAADTNTVTVSYNVQVNQTISSIQTVFDLVKSAYGTEGTEIAYNSVLENAAIDRAEDLVV